WPWPAAPQMNFESTWIEAPKLLQTDPLNAAENWQQLQVAELDALQRRRLDGHFLGHLQTGGLTRRSVADKRRLNARERVRPSPVADAVFIHNTAVDAYMDSMNSILQESSCKLSM